MGARTGQEYLARLREHGPEVWIGDERVKDVTAHPATAAAARELARLYDLQRDERYRDFTLFPSPKTGDLVSTQFLVPTSPDDWKKRRGLHKLWADATFGMMGRTTDFMACQLTGWYVSANHFAPYSDNVRSYFEYVRDNDLFLTHTLIDPPVDRSKPPSQQPDPFTYLGAVRETDQGLIVRGAKMLATAAPYADELWVWSFTFNIGLYGPEDAKYILGFAVPCSSPGLRFICRESYAMGENRFDHPLASRFDEMDAVAVFEDVLVPWDRVFIYRDPDKVARMYQTALASFSGHQTAIRFLSKLQLLAGLAKLGTSLLKTDQQLHVQDLIGEITSYIELTRAAILAAEAGAERDKNGVLIADKRPLLAHRNTANRWYPRVKENLQLMFGGALMYLPASVKAFDSPVLEDLQKYYRGAEVSAEERIKVLKAIADLAVSSFGGRHELYERFYSGDPLLQRAGLQFKGYDWTEPQALVEKFLGEYDLREVLAEVRADRP